MPLRHHLLVRGLLTTLLVVAFLVAASAQGPKLPPPAVSAPAPPPPIERVGPNLVRIGQVRVNTASREASVAGTVNSVVTLEFIANTRGGMKAYESALTLDTNAVTFNTALILIGLDKSHARVPTRHFDPDTPEGDPVEIWVDASVAGQPTRLSPEQLLFDKRLNQPLAKGNWVYTGSRVFPGGGYLAELDGVLIGFVHSPAPVIENPRGIGVSRYGDIILNPSLGLAPGTSVTLTVKALSPNAGDRR